MRLIIKGLEKLFPEKCPELNDSTKKRKKLEDLNQIEKYNQPER